MFQQKPTATNKYIIVTEDGKVEWVVQHAMLLATGVKDGWRLGMHFIHIIHNKKELLIVNEVLKMFDRKRTEMS